MAMDRIIQDSDESDGEISLVPSAVPVQHDTVTTPTIDSERTPDVIPPPRTVTSSDNDCHHPAGADIMAPSQASANLTVNFDEFLVSQGQEQLSLSQRQREDLWIGGQNAGVKRSRTIGVLGDVLDPDDRLSNGAKRQRVMSMGTERGSWGYEDALTCSRVGENMVFEQHYQQNAADAGLSWNDSEVQADQGNIESANAEDGESNAGPLTFDDARSTPLQLFSTESSNLGVHHQHKANLTRSKSMFVPTDSPHDTEPMSSITYARARRTMTSGEGHPPPSSANSIDELSLPVSVQVVVNKPTPYSHVAEDIPGGNALDDQDELDSDEFGGMPREMYKPRPSRSRRYDHSLYEQTSTHEITPVPAEDSQGSPQERNNDPSTNKPTNCAQPDSVEEPPAKLATNLEATATASIPKRRGPKKKKLKRGKTMSVIVNKNVDSDVEDDVIWVDERPAPTTLKNIKLPPLFDEARVKKEEKDATKTQDEPTTNSAQFEPDLPDQTTDKIELQESEPQAPPPKKRGRKRKKTNEPVTVEIPPRKSPDPDDQTSLDQQLPAREPLVELDQPALPQQSDSNDHLPTKTEEEPIPPPPQPETTNPPSTPEQAPTTQVTEPP